MSTLKDVISAMKEILLLTDKVDRAGTVLSEISNELRDHDRRLIRLETMVEIATRIREMKIWIDSPCSPYVINNSYRSFGNSGKAFSIGSSVMFSMNILLSPP